MSTRTNPHDKKRPMTPPSPPLCTHHQLHNHLTQQPHLPLHPTQDPHHRPHQIRQRQRQHNIANWKSQNPTFTLTLYDDADMLKMVTEEGEPLIPGMLDVYTSFQKNVERADFWRYLVVYLYGGVYVDSDVFPKQPLDTWHRFFDPEKAVGVPHLTLLNDTRVDGPWIQGFVGAEAHLTEPQRIQQNFAFRIQWCQWAFAFRPRHPFLLKLLRSIITHVHGERNGTVKSSGSWLIDLLMRTGPGRFTVVVEEWLKEQSRGRGGMLTSEDVVSGYEVVGSVGFMPPYAFGYRGWVDPPPPSADRLLVEHQFHQSWVQPPK
ncbi:hypothetical protein BC829DRAFT_487094 [Chytridium lagenaria]|nr:hypothetical protein BC829DRAFT_487094 [Chytridium lagenaria]